MTAGLANEAIDLTEAEAGTFADAFGGKKWIEGAFTSRYIHANPRIGHSDHDVLAGFDRLHQPGDIVLVEIGVGGFDRDPAAVGHGIAGVEREVEQRVFELIWISEGPPQSAGQDGFERYRFAERSAQKIPRCRATRPIHRTPRPAPTPGAWNLYRRVAVVKSKPVEWQHDQRGGSTKWPAGAR